MNHRKNHIAWILTICTLLLSVSVSAESYDFLPLNVDMWVQQGEEEVELNLWVQNNTNTPIIQFTFSADIYDAAGNLAEYTGTQTPKFYGIANTIYLPEHTNELYTWSLSDYQNPAAAGNIQISSATFLNRGTWNYSPSTPYSYEPDFKWENETMADGSVELYYDHSVHLFDTSLGSLSRDWYIWSDAVNNWVWFSGDMAADCYVWDEGAAIKLVINKNPALYTIKTFQVGMSPYITMRHMGVENAEILDRYATEEQRTFVQAEGNWNVALWDDSEFGQSRDWYIWSDEENDWVWFADSRGPAYKVSEEGTYSIKLVYNDNSQIQQIITFTAVRPQEGADSNETAA